MLGKGDADIRGALGSLIYSNNEIPFVFKLPKDEGTFINKKLPDDYKDLLAICEKEGLVRELKLYKIKKVCVLKRIDKNGNCYLISVKEANDPSAECIIVLFALTLP